MLILYPDDKGISHAAGLIRGGLLVAFPTETVYGLGADATSSAAIGAIFRAKGRPADNPLIAHVADVSMVGELAREIPAAAERLMRRFWPGPLTLVLQRRDEVKSTISAGLPSIAVRMPDHVVALELIRVAGVPLAAPSANKSGRPSPTCAAHVASEFGDEVAAVLDGGPCRVGMESTVLDLSRSPFRILRPGFVTSEDLFSVLGYEPLHAASDDSGSSPGIRHEHYKPRCAVELFDAANIPAMRDREGIIACSFDPPPSIFSIRVASLDEYATRLYALLRKADDRAIHKLYAELPPAEGIGIAIRDRLCRAAGVG